MGIIDSAEDLFDDFLDAARRPVDAAFGLAAAGQQFFAQRGEDAFAEAGGHAYEVGAADIAQTHGPGSPLAAVDQGMAGALREAFGPLTDRIRITFGAKLIVLSILSHRFGHPARGQTFGYDVYIADPKVDPQHKDYPSLLQLVAHELVHARQFEEAGKSLVRFGNRYFRQYFRAKFVYERNSMELEADAFAACFMKRRQRLASVEELHRETWSHGWTHFVPLMLDRKPHYLAYKTDGGLAALDAVGPQARSVKQVWREQWTGGWTSFVPYPGIHTAKPVNAPPIPLPALRLLAYKAATGEVAIDRLDGLNLVTGFRSQWTRGWTHMFGFTALQSRSFLFSYKAASGDAAIDELKPDGSGVTNLFRSKPGQFSAGWSAFAPFEFEGQAHYLAYKAAAGAFAIHRFLPGIDGVEERLRGTLILGATTLMPFHLEVAQGRSTRRLPHFLLYRAGSGGVAILRVGNLDNKPNTIGLEVIWCHKWSKGWTSFVPFELDGRPHYLAYKRDTGEAAFDRLSGQ